jgi:hypothetical protein
VANEEADGGDFTRGVGCSGSDGAERPTKAPAKLWSFALNLTKDSSQGVFEYACHEGNYAMKNILSAARAEEQKGR